MKDTRLVVIALVAGLIAAACAPKTVIVTPAPEASRGRSTAATLGIPPGHLPPPGRCRIWIPGRPPGRQARARSCNGILRVAPVGAWIVFRPDRDRRLVHVRYVDERRAGVIVRVRVFEVESGKYVRDEKP